MSQRSSETESFTRGFHGIKDHDKLLKMSFAELASELMNVESGSPAFMVIEREMKRVIAKDQAYANRTNIYIGCMIAGFFSLVGVLLGWWLRDSSSLRQASATVPLQNSRDGVQSKTAGLPPVQNAASK